MHKFKNQPTFENHEFCELENQAKNRLFKNTIKSLFPGSDANPEISPA